MASSFEIKISTDNFKIIVVVSSFILLFLSSILLRQVGSWSDSTQQLLLFCVASVLLTLPYYILTTEELSKRVKRFTKIAFCILPMSIPPFQETDFYRYSLDGLTLSTFRNPYAFSPADSFFASEIGGWTQFVNHQSLVSIYPPLAQLLFGLGTILNPFMWFGLYNEDWSAVGALNTWQLLLGYKIIIGIFSYFLIQLLSRKYWQFVAFHPLFLIQFIANGHIDGFLLGLLLPLLGTNRWFSLKMRLMSLLLGSLLKIYPIIFLPLLLKRYWHSLKSRELIKTFCLYFLLPLLLFCIVLIVKAPGFWHTTNHFGKNWLFFGYLHHWLHLFISVFSEYSSLAIAKYLSAFFGFALLVFILKQTQLNLYLMLLLLMTGFWSLAPTIHPWYLLPLLTWAGFSGFKYKSPIIWPLLANFSMLNYGQFSWLPFLQNSLYLVISFILAIDITRIYRENFYAQ